MVGFGMRGRFQDSRHHHSAEIGRRGFGAVDFEARHGQLADQPGRVDHGIDVLT